ncbi:tetratricopeptide repeat protein [uncultured Methanospirillum sp.]|uniref:tetratricopeptide repeat protein n=1 Tax=uncultured Methanospirillum sp. TaxID=262503 RepID=UPI0029C8994F|nr:tetratricopeptide repeat protein [uncultured Methanospirillum sp.]
MPDKEDQTFRSGMSAFKEKQYDEAAVQFTKAIQDHAVMHKSFNALGVTYSKIGKIKEAKACFLKAHALDPTNETYKRNLKKISGKISQPNKPPVPPPAQKTGRSLRKSNVLIMLGVTLVVSILIMLLGVQFISQFQPQVGTILGGTFDEGLLTPWMKSQEPEIHILPVVTVKVEDKRIEFMFNRDQDLSTVDQVETVISTTKGTDDQQATFPPVTSPQNNVYYAIDDPFIGKAKHLVMTMYYQDGAYGVVADLNLPPR